jgi:hypothetical protein
MVHTLFYGTRVLTMVLLKDYQSLKIIPQAGDRLNKRVRSVP